DTHQHLWDLTKFTLPWLKGDAVQKINRSFLMSDYLKLIGTHRIVKTVYMEVNVDSKQQTAEVEYVLDLCGKKDNPMCGAIIDGAKLGELCPKTTLVIDHCGNMPVNSDDKALRESWMRGMKEAAARPNTFCKISGIIVTTKPDAWKPSDLEPNISYCL